MKQLISVFVCLLLCGSLLTGSVFAEDDSKTVVKKKIVVSSSQNGETITREAEGDEEIAKLIAELKALGIVLDFGDDVDSIQCEGSDSATSKVATRSKRIVIVNGEVVEDTVESEGDWESFREMLAEMGIDIDDMPEGMDWEEIEMQDGDFDEITETIVIDADGKVVETECDEESDSGIDGEDIEDFDWEELQEMIDQILQDFLDK